MAEKPEDLNLPTSIVTKIIKDCLPSTCKVSKEANAAITKVVNFLPNIVFKGRPSVRKLYFC
jgi:histone H3/H4